MDYKCLSCELKDGIATIKMNRPKELNAMSTPMFEELLDLFPKVDLDPNVRVVILTGEGRAFCAGGDVAEMKEGYGGATGFYRHMELVNKSVIALTELSKPVIAAVNGVATGAGMNIALAADIAIASDKAKFSEIFGNVGLAPDVGGTYLLPRLVGRQKAKEIVFSFRMIDAAEALQLGLVTKVVPLEELMGEVNKLAAKIAQGPTLAFALGKKLINRSFETDIRTMLDLESLSQSIAGVSHDHKEGTNAFFEKRPTKFTGE
ncbi:MAG: enoyl-CoA hydratase/isomerase family protein [Acidaminococcales bacterium]|jgi:2-(1,2-epoxy-1,2-dihydrophenyl)acetyl-CoA isomerase|nr:enoyl-CoA hydratase/isomerase family protein [Acidaminococcales bacterium]